MERRRAVTIAFALTFALTFAVSAGYGSGAAKVAPDVDVVSPSPATGPRLLAAFDDGIGLVQAGLPGAIWREPDAVAALDGSALFAIRGGDRLVRLDPQTGAVTSGWSIAAGLSISAVAPGGRWIAMTDRTAGYGGQGRTSTTLVVFDSRAGTVAHRQTSTGDVQPEAFSTDGTRVFALHYFPDHYRVQTIDVATGEEYDTIDRDKAPVEDMHGHAIHGVLSADRTLLATLYRDPTDADEPAFVHVLDLRNGWSYCADLPRPFGTGTPGTDTIRLLPSGVVEVAATEAKRLADVRIDAVHDPVAPVTVTYRTGVPDPPPASLTAISGFDYVIAPIAAG